MQIHRSIRKGEGHPVFCEDFQIIENLNEKWTIAAVLDGCSSGKESHFASALFGKIIRKSISTLPHLKKVNPNFDLDKLSAEGIGTFLAENLFSNVFKINNYLHLDYTELLSTVLLSVYNVSTKEAWILVSGDGYIAINDEIIEINQHNRPDYLTYHLKGDFEAWFNGHINVYQEKEVTSIALSTDGIGSFYNPSRMSRNDKNIPEELLTLPVSESLDSIIEHWYSSEGLVHYDDISIIRIINR